MVCSRRPVAAALLGLALMMGLPQTLPAGAAPHSPTVAPVRPAKGISLQQLIEYWGPNARGVNSDFADMQAAGASWARVSLPYGTATVRMDRVVAAARAHHVRLLVVLGKPAPLNDLGSPASRAAYRSWVARTVKRYRAGVTYWEVMNEPNLRSSWNIDNRPGSNKVLYAAAVRRYVALLADAYRTVKANNPKAVVLFGGLSESTVERYLAVLLQTNAYRYFDVMSYHPFGRTPALVMSRFNALKTRLAKNPAWTRKAVWVTETGFNTSWTNKGGYVPNETLKARYLSQTIRGLYLATHRPVLWHTLHGANDRNPGYGLETKSKGSLGTRRLPAFTAFRAL